MKIILIFANKHPLAFGLVVTFSFILALIVSAVLGNLWSGETSFGQPGAIAGRLIAIGVVLVMVASLGWLGSAGFISMGGWQTWLWLFLALAYAVLASAYVMSGKIYFDLSNSVLTGLVILFILTAAFLEEVTFRGLILHGLMRAWGCTSRGLMRSVLVSSLLFCGIHLLDFLSGRPLLNVLLQSLQASFLRIYLAVLVLRSKSIFPAIFFHAILSLAGYLAFGSKGIEPAPSAWLLLSLVMLPIAVLGMYQLRGWPDGPSVPSTAEYRRLI